MLGEYLKDTVSLYLSDQKRIPRLQLNVYPKGSTLLQMYDAQFKSRLLSGIDQNGRAMIQLRGADERPHVQFNVDADDSPFCELMDGQGNPLFAVPPRRKP